MLYKYIIAHESAEYDNFSKFVSRIYGERLPLSSFVA